MELKYLIFDESIPVVFPALLLHSDVARAYPGHFPTSAGFYDPSAGATYGESTSLDIGPGGGDAARIVQFYEWHCYIDPSEEHY